MTNYLKTALGMFADLGRKQNKEAKRENTRINYNEKYYKDLDEIHEQYDVFIHDIKHMMRTVNSLAQEGRCKEINELIRDMQIKVGNIQNRIICSHKILNAMLAEKKAYADECGAGLELEVSEPLYLQNIDDVDLITLMGNLLDNAIEAEIHAHERDGVLCRIQMSGNGFHVVIQVENSYAGKSAGTESLQHLNNIGNKHGIGLKSVKKVVRKYGGIFDCWQNDGRYIVKVILPVRVETENEVFDTDTENIPAYAQSTLK
ncbi:MAG: ATP-binding protein [Ruminococcus flavefaciens]|nr:ATP-binding protein [Ruminococcus flavefaciens]